MQIVYGEWLEPVKLPGHINIFLREEQAWKVNSDGVEKALFTRIPVRFINLEGQNRFTEFHGDLVRDLEACAGL